MAYAVIDRALCDKRWFREIGIEGRYAYLMIACHPLLDGLGALRLSPEAAGVDLGINNLAEILAACRGEARFDASAPLIWLPAQMRLPDNANMLKAWIEEFARLPECDLALAIRRHARDRIARERPKLLDLFDALAEEPETVAATVGETVSGTVGATVCETVSGTVAGTAGETVAGTVGGPCAARAGAAPGGSPPINNINNINIPPPPPGASGGEETAAWGEEAASMGGMAALGESWPSAMPCRDGMIAINPSDVEGWKRVFPDLDIAQILRDMEAKLAICPEKRPQRSGFGLFAMRWLGKKQDDLNIARLRRQPAQGRQTPGVEAARMLGFDVPDGVDFNQWLREMERKIMAGDYHG